MKVDRNKIASIENDPQRTINEIRQANAVVDEIVNTK